MSNNKKNNIDIEYVKFYQKKKIYLLSMRNRYENMKAY